MDGIAVFNFCSFGSFRIPRASGICMISVYMYCVLPSVTLSHVRRHNEFFSFIESLHRHTRTQHLCHTSVCSFCSDLIKEIVIWKSTMIEDKKGEEKNDRGVHGTARNCNIIESHTDLASADTSSFKWFYSSSNKINGFGNIQENHSSCSRRSASKHVRNKVKYDRKLAAALVILDGIKKK